MMEGIHSYEKYEEVIQSKDNVVIKFYANWCPDCTVMNQFIPPILEQFPQTEFFELNRDEVERAAVENEVMGIPSLLIFQGGEKRGHLHSANAKTPESVEAFLREHL